MLFDEKMGISYQYDSALKDKCTLALVVYKTLDGNSWKFASLLTFFQEQLAIVKSCSHGQQSEEWKSEVPEVYPSEAEMKWTC